MFHTSLSDRREVILGQWAEDDEVAIHIHLTQTLDDVWPGRLST